MQKTLQLNICNCMQCPHNRSMNGDTWTFGDMAEVYDYYCHLMYHMSSNPVGIYSSKDDCYNRIRKNCPLKP